jgi:two-component system response regulator PhcR
LPAPLPRRGPGPDRKFVTALARAQANERAMNENRVAALRETLGFLAHELNTPLATVRGCVGLVA